VVLRCCDGFDLGILTSFTLFSGWIDVYTHVWKRKTWLLMDI